MSPEAAVRRALFCVVVAIGVTLLLLLWLRASTVYYISPQGSDSNSGRSRRQPWATFTHAWTILQPGDTLLVMDGTYYQSIRPTINGAPGKFITLKAEHDGQAVIDGQNQRVPVWLGEEWNSNDPNDQPNPVGNCFAIEGLVAKNSAASVYQVYSRNVILRRDSGYNAESTRNTDVFEVWSKGTPAAPANILVEDSVAAGSGRKMFMAYDTYVNVIFRRNFAAWQWWQGGDPAFCPPFWPWGDGIEIYPLAYGAQPDVPNNSIVENDISFGMNPMYGTSLAPNPGRIIGNTYAGNMSIGAGMRWDNVQRRFIAMTWDRSQVPQCGARYTDFTNSAHRAGFVLGVFGRPYFKDNVFQDLFAWSNGALGLTAGPWAAGSANNRLIRATLVNNGQGSPPPAIAYSYRNTSPDDLAQFDRVSDLKIGDMPNYDGKGAQLQYRYVNGQLTNQPLWPWPMEERIRNEFATELGWQDFSVTNTIYPILVQYGAVPDATTPQW